MNEDITRHGEVEYRADLPDSEGVFEHRGGYLAPRTLFELPEVPGGPAQGAASTAASDAQPQTSTSADGD